MAANPDSLVAILEETKRLVALPQNDFVGSGWDDRSEALTEIDGHLTHARAGECSRLSALQTLFAPTGALQELSIGSGWATDYLALAARFDTVCGE